MFQTVPVSIIRSFSLYTQQWYMCYRFCWQLASRIRMELHPDPARKLVGKPVWHIPLLCVQWKSLDDGQRNCLKHVEFYCKNKFQKLVHLVCFIMRIYHDEWSSERQTRDFFLIWNVRTGFGAHPVLYLLRTWDSCIGSEVAGIWSCSTHPNVVPRLRMSVAVPQFFLYAYMVYAKKTRYLFLFKQWCRTREYTMPEKLGTC